MSNQQIHLILIEMYVIFQDLIEEHIQDDHQIYENVVFLRLEYKKKEYFLKISPSKLTKR
jgi:hypothetical protein